MRCEAGIFDGLRLDDGGRIWAATGEGLHCFAPDGTLLGVLRTPEVVANLVSGGPKRNRVHLRTTSVYSLMVNVTDMP